MSNINSQKFHTSPDRVVKAREFLRKHQYYCYGWWRPSLFKYLYIGKTQFGDKRLFKQKHDVIGRVEKIVDHDEFHFWDCDGMNLDEYEKFLIAFHRPVHNVVGKRSWWVQTKQGEVKKTIIIPKQRQCEMCSGFFVSYDYSRICAFCKKEPS